MGLSRSKKPAKAATAVAEADNQVQRFIATGSAAYPALPLLLDGWQWLEHGNKGALKLASPDGSYVTEPYPEPGRVIEWAVAWQRRQSGYLPPVALDLRPGWGWQADPAGVRLTELAEGWVTAWRSPARAAECFDLARAILARHAPDDAPPAYRPGPDLDGIYRRPPHLGERIQVAPAELLDGRWQPRQVYAEAALAELVESVREHGVLEDLLALVNEDGRLELIAGHRRKRAATTAERASVPVKVLEVTLAQAWEIALISNDQRADLTEVERGEAYERIIAEQGISEAELARRLSRPRAYIQQRRALARAAADVKKALVEGSISFTQARGICEGSSDDQAAQASALRQVLDEAKRGRTISGEQAKGLAEKAVQDGVLARLKDLGWQVATVWSPTETRYWFGGAERPQTYTPAELLSMAREGRAPAGEMPAPFELTDAQQGWLFRLGNYSTYSNSFVPWLKLAKGNEAPVFLAGDEFDAWLVPRIAPTQQAIAELAAAGWAVSWYSERSHQWGATGPNELKVYGTGVDQVASLLAKVRAGEISPAAPPPPPSEDQRCGRCGKDLRGSTGRSYSREIQAYVCPDCKQVVAFEQHAARALAGEKAMGDPAWLEHVPDDVLRLLALADKQTAAAIGGFNAYQEDAAGTWAAGASRADLLVAARGTIEGWAWDWREDLGLAPTAEAIAERVGSTQGAADAAADLGRRNLAVQLAAVEALVAGGDTTDDAYAQLEECWEALSAWQERFAGDDEEAAPELLERLRNLQGVFDEDMGAEPVTWSSQVAAIEARIADGSADPDDDAAELAELLDQVDAVDVPADVVGLRGRIVAAQALLAGALAQVAD